MDGSLKRKHGDAATGPQKAPKLSFAARMMARMGYQEGEGLGRDGQGIVNPIEVKLRPQGVGVGAVKEKTQQHKDEEKRAAMRRGEEYVDSSEEEKRKKRERRQKAKSVGPSESGTSTPGGIRKRKIKYKTVADVQAAASGLQVPPSLLGAIVDATGPSTKLLTSVAGFMTPSETPMDSEEDMLARREAMETDACIDAWKGLQQRRVYIEEHRRLLETELKEDEQEIGRLQGIIAAGERFKAVIAGNDKPEARLEEQWAELIDLLERFQSDYSPAERKTYGLSNTAVAALHPLFKRQVAEWEPLEDGAFMTKDLARITAMLGLDDEDGISAARKRNGTTQWETLVYTVWLPKIRTAVTNWDVYDPTPMITVTEAWRALLPDFVYANMMDTLVVPKLLHGLSGWGARKRKHKHRHTAPPEMPPHTWIFPWLPLLPEWHLDPNDPEDGLLVEVKRKLRSAVDICDLSNGALAGLQEWRSLLGSELDKTLVRYVLPRLAKHMASRFEVDPSDQDLRPLKDVLSWANLFHVDVMARLMVAELFPKWMSTLHIWLTSDSVVLTEVGEWYLWWKQQLPEALSNQHEVAKGWAKGQEMINNALDLFEEGKPLSALPPPPAGPAPPIAKDPTVKKIDRALATPKRATAAQAAADFRDVVEAWCAEENLLMVPLREAHLTTGLPLFRITASVTGKGGVVVYLRGDVVWAQRKGSKEAFEPVGLEQKLIDRAEGR